MTDLKDLKVLITGASSGLGQHFARHLSSRGAAVALGARRVDNLRATAAEITAAGGVAHAIALDVADRTSVEAGVAEATDLMGGLNALVNNAGVTWGGRSLEMPDEEWRHVMSVNLDGVFRTAKAAGDVMARSGGGAIVNIASILGLRTGQGVAAYSASKAAVAHLTHSLALEWARHGIRVNALAPGYFPTEINDAFLESDQGQALKARVPMRRFGAYSDLNGPLELLISDAGAYVTGVVLPVDGGHLCCPT